MVEIKLKNKNEYEETRKNKKQKMKYKKESRTMSYTYGKSWVFREGSADVDYGLCLTQCVTFDIRFGRFDASLIIYDVSTSYDYTPYV